jgi:hypothetical protein
MSYSNNYLDKLIHLVTVEQLSNILRDTKIKPMDDKMDTTDILSFPIVQKIIHSYENELTEQKTCNCKCNEEKNVLLHKEIITNLNEIKRQIVSLQTQIDTINENKAEVVSISLNEKGQTKLTQFSNFTSKEKLIPVKEEHIVLKIEEKSCKNDDDDDECEEVFVDNTKTNVVHEICEDSDDDEEEVEGDDEEEVEGDDEEEVEGDDEEEVEGDDEEEVEGDDEEEVEVEEEEEVEGEEENDSESEVGYEEEEEEIIKEKEEIIKDENENVEKMKDEEIEEEDEEVFEIEIDDVTYFATDEENGILYEADENGEVGKKVGIIKNGEPQFLS